MENNFKDYSLFGHKRLEVFTNTIVPQHIRMNYPNFVKFIDLYLEKSSNEGEATEFIHNMLAYANIDETSQFFVEEFCKNYLKPLHYLEEVNRKTLVKWIKQWYESTGSEQSFRFLFRVLYNKDISFYYPSVDMLRVSDGKWVVETMVRIKRTNNIELFNDVVGTILFGTVSGAKGLIERVVHHSVWVDHDEDEFTENEHYDIVDVYITDYDPMHPISHFLPEERVLFTQLTDSDVKWHETLTYIVNDITLKNSGGNYYKAGDVIHISHGIGVDAQAVVESVSSGNFTGAEILDGGWGYSAGLAQTGYVEVIDKNGNTFYVNVNDERINDENGTLIPTKTVPDKIFFESDNGFGSYGYVSEIGDDGKITGIRWVERGEGYFEYPNISIDTISGSGAVLRPIPNGVGAVSKIKIVNPGYNYSPITPDMITRAFANIYVKISSKSTNQNPVYNDYVDLKRESLGAYNPDSHEYYESVYNSMNSSEKSTYNEKYNNTWGSMNDEERLLFHALDKKYKPYIFPIKFEKISNPLVAKGDLIIQFHRDKNNNTPLLQRGEMVGVMYIVNNATTGEQIIEELNNHTLQFAFGKIKRIDNNKGYAVIEQTSRIPLRKEYAAIRTINGVEERVIVQSSLVGIESHSNYNWITSIEEALFNISTGPLITLSGYYKNMDGHLDSKKMIQDSYFYQAFSYVLKVSDLDKEIWESAVNDSVHPSGLIVFGNGEKGDAYYTYGGDPINEGWRTDAGIVFYR